VKHRNKIAHPSGTVFFNDRGSIDREMTEIMREVENIQSHMRPVILEVYQRFLLDSSDVEEREYAAPEQEIEGNLVHRSYISREDIAVCVTYDIGPLQAHPNFAGIETLHACLKLKYA
jgi:hypothetical protein